MIERYYWQLILNNVVTSVLFNTSGIDSNEFLIESEETVLRPLLFEFVIGPWLWFEFVMLSFLFFFFSVSASLELLCLGSFLSKGQKERKKMRHTNSTIRPAGILCWDGVVNVMFFFWDLADPQAKEGLIWLMLWLLFDIFFFLFFLLLLFYFYVRVGRRFYTSPLCVGIYLSGILSFFTFSI